LSFDSTDPDPEIVNPNIGNVGNAEEAGQNIAKEAGKNAQRTANQEAADMVKQFQQEWGPHYAALQNEKLKKINELAAQSTYHISLQKSTGKTFINPFGEEEVEYLDEWESPKPYKRKKVNQSQWSRIEEMKGEYAEEEDPKKRAKLYTKMHEGMAYLYLGMTPTDFARTDWEEIKMILDACNHRTRYGLPNSAKPSTNSSMSGAVS